MATVLVVDDSATMRQMVTFTLQSAGFETIEGENGCEALRVSSGQKVDLVITDLNMPEMDGITLVRELRSKADFKFTPILLLTTESHDSKKQEGNKPALLDGLSSRSIQTN